MERTVGQTYYDGDTGKPSHQRVDYRCTVKMGFFEFIRACDFGMSEKVEQ